MRIVAREGRGEEVEGREEKGEGRERSKVREGDDEYYLGEHSDLVEWRDTTKVVDRPSTQCQLIIRGPR